MLAISPPSPTQASIDAWRVLPSLVLDEQWGLDALPTGMQSAEHAQTLKRERRTSGSTTRPTGVIRRPSSVKQELVQLEQQCRDKLNLLKDLSATHQTLQDKAWVLEQVLSVREAEMTHLAEIKAGAVVEDPFQAMGYPMAEVMAASNQKVLTICKDVQSRLGEHLLVFENTGCMPPDLLKLGKAMVQSFKYMAGVRPDFDQFNGLHVDTVFPGTCISASAELMPAPPEGHWRKVAVCAQLDAQTLARCHILKTLVQGWRRRIIAERKRLSDAFAVNTRATAISPGPASPTGTPLLGHSLSMELSSHTPAASMLPTQQADRRHSISDEDLAARMADNLGKERGVNMLLMVMLYERIFSVLEACRVVVHSYPYLPDEMLLLEQLSALHCEATPGVTASISSSSSGPMLM